MTLPEAARHPVDVLRAFGHLTIVADARQIAVTFQPSGPARTPEHVAGATWPEVLVGLARIAQSVAARPVAPAGPATAPAPVLTPDEEHVLGIMRHARHGASWSLLVSRTGLPSKVVGHALAELERLGLAERDGNRYTAVGERS